MLPEYDVDVVQWPYSTLAMADAGLTSLHRFAVRVIAVFTESVNAPLELQDSVNEVGVLEHVYPGGHVGVHVYPLMLFAHDV